MAISLCSINGENIRAEIPRMKTKLLLIASLLANTVLVALLIRGRSGHESQELTRSTDRITATTEVSRIVREAEARHEATATTVVRTNAAQLPHVWKQVAAADYQQFADNLRAIGVPEETVRDIVMFDLMKTLGEDMTGLSRRVSKPFWQANAYGTNPPSVSNDVAQAMAQLTVIAKQSLGIEPSEWFADRWGWTESVMSREGGGDDFEPLVELFVGLMGSGYEWMPTERARKLHRLITANEKAQEQLHSRIEAVADRRSPEYEALQLELSKVIQAGEKIEDNFLTPEEKRERDLRYDSTLQQQLAGVEVTRAEYEKLHDLARSVGSTEPPYFKPNTPEAAQALGILGPDRFAEFQRGADHRYGELLGAAENSGIPKPVATKIYELAREAEQQIGSGLDVASVKQRLLGEINTIVDDPDWPKSIGPYLEAYLQPRQE